MFGKHDSPTKRFHPAKGLFFVVAALAFLAVVGAIVMYLWNAILPDVSGVKPISFWQAVGLLILFRLLSGGFYRGRRYKKNAPRKQYWKEKWMGMNEEERHAFKKKWKDHCGKKEKE